MTVVDLARRLLALELSKAKDPDRQKRVEGALSLIENVQPKGSFYSVSSRSHPGKYYHVTAYWCTCPDHGYRQSTGIECAHRIAVQAHKKAQRNLSHVEACREMGLL